MHTHRTYDVAVVGGGIMGVLIALAARDAGLSVCICDSRRCLFGGTTRAGFGSLTPYSDPIFKGAARDFAARGVALYRSQLLPRLGDIDRPVRLNEAGLLDILDEDRVAEGKQLQADLVEAGYSAQMLDVADALILEPNLADDFACALLLDEPSLDTSDLLAALTALVAQAGPGLAVRLEFGVSSIRPVGSSWTLESGDSSTITAGSVVIATGVTNLFPGGIPAPELRWLRGDALCVEAPDGRDLVRRHLYRGRGFITPRTEGRLFLGATYDEEPAVPVRALERRDQIEISKVVELVAANTRILPGIAKCDLIATWRGWRPATLDQLPILGPGPDAGIVYATAFVGLGLTMGPAVAEAVATGLIEDDWSAIPTSFSPLRPGVLADPIVPAA